MLYTLQPSLAQRPMVRMLGILGFIILTAIGAQIAIPRDPVPVTMQVLMVLLAGLTLGPRDGALSMLGYLGAIAAGMPLAANGLGTAALAGPTAGYLYSFPIAAWITGMLAIREHVVIRWLASMAGVALIYLIGATYLKSYLGESWATAVDLGVCPFLLIDILKALAAAMMGEGLRRWWTSRLTGGFWQSGRPE